MFIQHKDCWGSQELLQIQGGRSTNVSADKCRGQIFPTTDTSVKGSSIQNGGR